MLPHMTFAEQVAAARAQAPHWTPKMRNHLRRLMRRSDRHGDVTFAIWLSDAHGRPANHEIATLEARRAWTASPGLVQRVDGPLSACSCNALHATLSPHRWRGSRAWLVAFVGDVEQLEDKIAGLHREIVGEILPEHALSAGLAIKLGRRDIAGAHLVGADLVGADLTGAYLTGADLTGANLRSAYLGGAHLAGADLTGAYLTGADLTGAYLTGANLRSAYLGGAHLAGAHLVGADLTGAYWPKSRPSPDGWAHDPPVSDREWVVLRRKEVP